MDVIHDKDFKEWLETASSLLSLDVPGIFLKAIDFHQKNKINSLLSSISNALQDDFNGNSEEFKKHLLKLSHCEWFQEAINQAVLKAALSNSKIAIRMMAIVVAVKVNGDKFLSYYDLHLLRTLQEITDDEIIYLSRIHAVGNRGIMGGNEYQSFSNDEDPYLADQHLYRKMTTALTRFDLISLRETLGGINRTVIFNDSTAHFLEIYKRATAN